MLREFTYFLLRFYKQNLVIFDRIIFTSYYYRPKDLKESQFQNLIRTNDFVHFNRFFQLKKLVWSPLLQLNPEQEFVRISGANNLVRIFKKF